MSTEKTTEELIAAYKAKGGRVDHIKSQFSVGKFRTMSHIIQTHPSKSEPTRSQLTRWMNFEILIATQQEIAYMHQLYAAGSIQIENMDEWFYDADADNTNMYIIKPKNSTRYLSRLREEGVQMYRFLNDR